MRKLLLCCAAMLLLVAACADDGADDQADATDEPVATQPACDDAEPSPPPTEEEVSDEKPQIEVPDGDPPCDLVIHDIVVGDGAEAPEGATVTVNYVGVLWDSGEEFDSSYGAQPATFPLDGVIKGWTDGIPGMKEGGRRQLIIPPGQAYGAAGRPGIPPNSTLVFIVDLIRVAEEASPQPTG